MLLRENVYNGRDNTVELALMVDRIPIDHTTITRAVLTAGATVVDSASSPALFDFTHPDRLVMKLGSAGLAAGKHSFRLVVYDAQHPNGWAWEPTIELTVQ